MNPFATAAMAEGYARSRPQLHGGIVERMRAALGIEYFGWVAVDIGCGSGLSTRPLVGHARCVVGIEPVFEMAACARTVAPGARFLQGRGEAMPFRTGSVDLLTAAGSLNYARPVEVLREAHRVLMPGGVLCAYDFSQGRTLRESPTLAEWFEEFLARYPRPASEATPLDPRMLAEMAEGFDVAGSEALQIELPFGWQEYANYLMTETNVAAAMRRGESPVSIREWVERTLPSVFDGEERAVIFPGYWIAFRRTQQ